MSLTPGARLGSCEIVSPIGALRLRSGPSRARSRDERIARFKREAHALASLNHPHIAHLYGFEAGPATSFLVMELVEGPTLADLIAMTSGGLPLDQAIPIARQIAEALEAARRPEAGPIASEG